MKRGSLLLLACLLLAAYAQEHAADTASGCGERAFPLSYQPDLTVKPPGPLESSDVNHGGDLDTFTTADFQGLLTQEKAVLANETAMNATWLELRAQFNEEWNGLFNRILEILSNNDRVEWDDVELSARHVLLALSAIARNRSLTRVDMWFAKQLQFSLMLKLQRDVRIAVLAAHVNASVQLDSLVESCKNPVNQLLFGNVQCTRSGVFASLNSLNGTLTGLLKSTLAGLLGRLNDIKNGLDNLTFQISNYEAALTAEAAFFVDLSPEEEADNSDFQLVKNNLETVALYQFPRWDQIQASIMTLIQTKLDRIKGLIAAHWVGYTIADGASLTCIGVDGAAQTIRCTFTGVVARASDSSLDETVEDGVRRLARIIHSIWQAFCLAPRIDVERVEGPDVSGAVTISLTISRLSIVIVREASNLLDGVDIQVNNETVQQAYDNVVNEYEAEGANLDQLRSAVSGKLTELRTAVATKVQAVDSQLRDRVATLNNTVEEKSAQVQAVVDQANANLTAAVRVVIERLKAALDERKNQVETSVAVVAKAVAEADIRVALCQDDLLVALKAVAVNTNEVLAASLAKAVEFAKEALAAALRDREVKVVIQMKCEEQANTTDTETREAVDQFEVNFALFIKGSVAVLADVKQQIRANKERFIRIVRAVIVAFRDSISDVHVTFGANLNDNTEALDINFTLFDNGMLGEVTAERRAKHKALLKSLLASQCGQQEVNVADAPSRKRQAADGDNYTSNLGSASTPPPPSTSGAPPSTSTTGGSTPNPSTTGSTPNPSTTGNNPNPPSGSSAATIVGSFVLMICVLAISFVF